jgi:hypothetical protein
VAGLGGVTYGAGGVADAVVVESFHDGAVFFEVEAVELVFVVVAVLRGDGADEVDVLVGVEGGEVFLVGVVVVYLPELQVLGGSRGTMVSKCWSNWYLRTISSVMATRSGFIGCAKA